MNDQIVSQIATAAQAALEEDDRAFRTAWAAVPVPLRAALGVAYLTGADAPLSENNVAKIGGYSRTTAKSKHGEMLELLRAAVPAVLMRLSGTARTGIDVAQLSAELQAANETIASLREQLAVARAERETALSYATDLHRQLKPEYEDLLRTRAERVVDVTPRLRPVPSPPTDDGAS